MGTTDGGLAYTSGASFRARAEARQRQYRSDILRLGWSSYGHLLDDEAAAAGANFTTPLAFIAANERRDLGKGVAPRTFNNMLSSQAMCFNLFAPLAADPELASKIFERVLPGIGEVRSIQFEYTPSNETFGDQAGQGGVDCDLLVEAAGLDGEPVVVAIETKFVEPEFSVCGYRKAGRAKKGQPVCPDDVEIGDGKGCLYTARRGFRYWERAWEAGTLRREAFPTVGCPFPGSQWQLWVNHTLAHTEAKRRGAGRALFAVCAPENNNALNGEAAIQSFQNLLVDPTSARYIGVNALIQAIGETVPDPMRRWQQALVARYCEI